MNTTPTTTPTPERELREIGQAIETWRNDIGLTKTALLQRYPELGTDSTFGKILAGKTEELKIEKWLPQYKAAWEQIQTGGKVESVPLIESFSTAEEVCVAYLKVKKNIGTLARFVLVLGGSGVGKSSSIQVLKNKPYGGNIIVVEASDAWRMGKNGGTAPALLRAIAKAVGVRDLPASRDGVLNEVVERLNEQRRGLVIEEAHHLCPQGINTLKTLINLTPVIVIATAMPPLWDRLSGSRHAWLECRQLTGNRMAKRIHLTLQAKDVLTYIETRCPDLPPEDARKVTTSLMADAPTHGNMRLVVAATDTFLELVTDGEPMSLSTFKAAIAMEKKNLN